MTFYLFFALARPTLKNAAVERYMRGLNHLKKSRTHFEIVIKKVEKSRKKSKNQEESHTEKIQKSHEKIKKKVKKSRKKNQKSQKVIVKIIRVWYTYFR